MNDLRKDINAVFDRQQDKLGDASSTSNHMVRLASATRRGKRQLRTALAGVAVVLVAASAVGASVVIRALHPTNIVTSHPSPHAKSIAPIPPPLSPTRPRTNGLIAVSANPRNVGGGEVGDIYLVREGAPARRIIGSDGDGVAQACPRFSPDGGRLAYGEARASDPVTTFRGVWPVSDRAVVVVGLNDRGDPSPPIVRVTLPKDPGQIACPKWSPSGRHVAFRVGSELWVADAASGRTAVFPVTEAPWGQQGFEWSRDGSIIAVSEPGHIRVVRMDGGPSTRIAVNGATPGSLGWTAGDTRIMYIVTDEPGDGLAVRFVGVDGNNDTKLPDTTSLHRFYYAVISPDGTRVAYLQRTNGCVPVGCSQEPAHLVTMGTDGSNRVEPLIPPGFEVSGLQWSPDGKRLLFGSINGVVSVGVAPGSPAAIYSRGELNLESSGSEVTWQPVLH
jgi:dipeptidyl aminopeptidase/acylaminoacyl peptidase